MPRPLAWLTRTLKTRIGTALGVALLGGSAGAEGIVANFHCAQTAAFAPGQPDSPDYRKYAPDRTVDMLHLLLDVTPDFARRTVAGSATWKFKPISTPCRELKLDGVNLTVSAVTSTEKIQAYQVTEDQVVITFEAAVPTGREASVTVHYQAQPDKGLYFRTPELGFKAEDAHIWTQGEPHEARHWYPGYDYPNEKFTTEMIIHVPEGIVALANGRKLSEEKEAGGMVKVHWLQDKPMANYLVALVAGKLKFIEDKHGNIPLRFWTPASEIEHAASSFAGTREMMAFFEKETGQPYPWDKYDQVCIQDYHWGGMENTTLTTLNINTLFPKNTENLRNSQGLVAHELAHQWFGDLLTCKDWSHLWLNEGFASFYDELFTEHFDGRDEFLYRIYEGMKSLTAGAPGTKSIVWRKYGDANEQFDHLAYGKGSWVLNMLRNQLGPELYRECIKTFVQRHKFGTVVTEDLRAVIEELSGRSFDQFFDQWVHHAGHPILDIDYSWDETTKLAKVSVRQTQPVSEMVPLFRFPLPVRFSNKNGNVDRVMEIRDKAGDFTFPLESQPQVVRIDPTLSVLAKINFRVPSAMQAAMLSNVKDVVGQFLAVEQLAERRDHEAVKQLRETLNGKSMWAVRVAASQALRRMYSDEAFDALAASLKQSDARVRKQVVNDATAFYRPAAFAIARQVVEEEKNPDIVGVALTALAPTGTNARPVLIKHLNGESFRHHLAETAMNTMRSQNDAFYVEPLRHALSQRKQAFGSRTIVIALEVLAHLSRDLEDKAPTRELLASFTSDPRQNVKTAALSALGNLRDEKALPVLERYLFAGKNSAERSAAERAIETIRASRKATLEAGDVRREVIDLQKQNKELRKDLDALKKKVDAASAASMKKSK